MGSDVARGSGKESPGFSRGENVNGYRSSWLKRIAHWTEKDTAFLSLAFTWQLPQTWSLAIWYSQQGYRVRAGGPAVSLMPHYLQGVASLGGEVNALPRHNPNATFTSRGCPRRCTFCAVPKICGELQELEDWDPKPIVCDDNLLACSSGHFDSVVDRLKPLKGVDFNQGLDVRLLSNHHIERLRELNLVGLRFAWDDVALEPQLMSALTRCSTAGFPKKITKVYVLFNYKDSPDDALYRCQTLKRMGILPNVQRYQPLDTLRKNSYIAPKWDARLLSDFTRYWSRQIYLRPIPFEEYRRLGRPKPRQPVPSLKMEWEYDD